jgi:hypothetical protein
MQPVPRFAAAFMLLVSLLGVLVFPTSVSAATSTGRSGPSANPIHHAQTRPANSHDKPVTDTPTATPTETETTTPIDTPTDSATDTPTEIPTDTPVSTMTPTSAPSASATGTPAQPKAKAAVVAATTVPPAQLTLSTSSGVVGSTVTVSLANFPKLKSASVTIGGFGLGSIYVGSSRSGSKTFTIPRISGGTYTIRATSGGLLASHSYKVLAHEAVSTTTVTRGQTMTVFVDGFRTNETLALRLYLPNGSSNYSTLLQFSVNASGYGQVSFAMPTSATTGNRLLASYSASTHAGVFITVLAGSPTKLLVTKTNSQGTHLVQACFSVFTDAGGGALGTHVADACDPQDGQLDGITTITGLAGGDYVLKEFHSPNGYLNGTTKAFHSASSGTTSVTVVDQPGGATLTIHKVDASSHAALTGACWVVYRDTGNHQIAGSQTVEGRCDASDGSENGITPFTGLAAGNYILYERVAPSGYALAANVLFTVDANQDPVSVTVQDTSLS